MCFCISVWAHVCGLAHDHNRTPTSCPPPRPPTCLLAKHPHTLLPFPTHLRAACCLTFTSISAYPMVCAPDKDYDGAALCYDKCQAGYTGKRDRLRRRRLAWQQKTA